MMRRALPATVLSVLSVLLLASASVAQAPTTADDEIRLASPRTGHTATALGSGVLVAGGSDGESALASVELIDPVEATIEGVGSLVVARSGHTATPLPDGRVLIAGGRAHDLSLAEAELFDPDGGASEFIGPMLQARAGHKAVPLPDGRVLLVGGVDGEELVPTAELYDPATGTFDSAAAPLASHLDGAAVPLPDGRVLLTGDSIAATEPAPAADEAKKTKKTNKSNKRSKKKTKKTDAAPGPVFAQVYDPQADRWTSIDGGDTPRGHAAVVLDDGRVLLTGGMIGTADHGPTQAFDPVDVSFAELPPLATPRSEHSATLLPDGRVVIIGGSDFGYEVAPIEVFDPVAGTFTTGGELDLPREGSTATLLPDGRVLIAGGSFASLVLDDILLYDPADGDVSPLTAAKVPAVAQTRAEAREIHGAPDAFVILFGDEVVERWSYHLDGVGYVLTGDEVLATEAAPAAPETGAGPLPYDPDVFASGMTLDAVLAATGVSDYEREPATESIPGGELFFADRITWGMVDDRLRSVMAGASAGDAGGKEASE